ncbi:hypothetical protein LMG3431_02624 [Achromobacter pestifer]|uniref:Uncharacterized protein n=1 Tax=Achromobacter pestifer TaxID=1353889 RepID=A0A6S6YVL2_9BURK|nr:hypothetical protein LMG3431_02624 [Achromobacter pestifer]
MTLRAASTSLTTYASAAPAVDPLEFARGALCAATFVAADTARETHVTKLHRLFERAGLAPSMEAALGTMQFLREAEPLGGGYWTPAPVRTVELGPDCHLLVGPQPTLELQRHVAGLRRAGGGRVMNRADTAAFPRQSKVAWRGSDGNDASSWTQSAINSAMKELAPSVVADNLQIFAVQQAGGQRRGAAWFQAGTSPACEWRGVGLFRARTGASRYRYFLGKYEAGRDFLEGPAVLDAARFQFGLAALQSQPFTAIITSNSGTTTISLAVAPPRSMRRLLVALCEEDPKSFGRVWTCGAPACRPVLLEALQELNCETKHHE